jgi:tetratricopeptide (TPR) repeat protein
MQMANLYKYIGLLKGKKGQFEEAKSSIQKAITIYISQGFGQGVAVSEINLADVYFREKEYEESIVYFNKSKKFWMDNDDKSRIYTDNILGIRIFAAINRDELVESLINENRKIEHEIEVNGFVKTKFDEVINEIKIEVSH